MHEKNRPSEVTFCHQGLGSPQYEYEYEYVLPTSTYCGLALSINNAQLQVSLKTLGYIPIPRKHQITERGA